MHRRTLTQEADARAISAFLICLDDTLSTSSADLALPPTTLPYHSAVHPPRSPLHPTFPATAQTTLYTRTRSHLAPPLPEVTPAPPQSSPQPPPPAQALQPPQQSLSLSSSLSRSSSLPPALPQKGRASAPPTHLIASPFLPHNNLANQASQLHSSAAEGEGGRLALTLAWACLLAVEGAVRHEGFLSAYEDGSGAVCNIDDDDDDRNREVGLDGGSAGLRKGSVPLIKVQRRRTGVGSLRSMYSSSGDDGRWSLASGASSMRGRSRSRSPAYRVGDDSDW